MDKFDTIDRAVEAIRVSLGLGPDVMLRLMEVMKLSCTPCSLDEMCSILPPTSYEKPNLSCSDLVVEEVTEVRCGTTGWPICLDTMMLCFQFDRSSISCFSFSTTNDDPPVYNFLSCSTHYHRRSNLHCQNRCIQVLPDPSRPYPCRSFFVQLHYTVLHLFVSLCR